MQRRSRLISLLLCIAAPATGRCLQVECAPTDVVCRPERALLLYGDPAGAAIPGEDVVELEWRQQAYAKASNAGNGDNLGEATAISGDTMVVGAPLEDSNQTTITNGSTASADDSNADSGAAYVFVRNNGAWEQQAYLKAPNNGAGDEFGAAVAIDADTVAVGAPLEDSNQTTITNGSTASADDSNADSGAVYIFVRSGSTWSQQAYIKADNNTTGGDEFGSALAIDGDTLIAGASFEDSNQNTITNGATASADDSNAESGAAYVYVRSGSTWSQQAYLKAANNDAGDEFGVAVDVSGDTAAVGAWLEASAQSTITNGTTASGDNSSVQAGAIYVYQRSGSTWPQQAYLKAPNNASDRVGFRIALDADTLVAGVPLEDNDQNAVTNGATISDNDLAFNSGAAYVFYREAGLWSLQAYLKPTNNGDNSAFGASVAVEGDRILVGASGEDSNATEIVNGAQASADDSNMDSGAAYAFLRDGVAWSQTGYFKAPNNDDGDRYGQSVALDPGTAAVGAIREDSSQTTITNGTSASADDANGDSGAAYVIARLPVP